MAERREERRRQVGALLQRLGRLSLGEEMRPLDRNRDDTAKRVERADVERWPSVASIPTGCVPRRSGTNVMRASSEGAVS